MDGELMHNDICKYQLNMEALVSHFKPIMGRVDSKDIYDRIMMYSYPNHEAMDEVTKFVLPTPMLEMVQSHAINKIEYMKDGHYVPMTSEGYDNAIMQSSEMMRIASAAKIPIKMADTLNLDDVAVGYRMWVESVMYPMMMVTYTGPGYWKEDGVVCYMTVRMMSVILSPTRIVTVTTVGRGTIMKL